MQVQDLGVEELMKIVRRQKELGIQINEELEVQNEMLRMVDEDVTSTSSQAPTTAPDSNAATWGSATTNTPSRPATVEENRAEALGILQGGARGASDERAAETLVGGVTKDPVSAG
ncbi:uncharacterized protein BDV14DRAFT_199988 [Aspergillus stella-maris]|uniref:uncharacterized protein n=1 Tax=Aspergillus stella-maris TaxID=1810926 RepID=UPI003CCE0AB5